MSTSQEIRYYLKTTSEFADQMFLQMMKRRFSVSPCCTPLKEMKIVLLEHELLQLNGMKNADLPVLSEE